MNTRARMTRQGDDMSQVHRSVRDVVLAGILAIPAAPVLAQQQPAQESIEEVVVTGIRYSLEQSMEQKRKASTVVEVVSAEDIGKLPDKDVADALQRVPGVNISSAAGGEGGFDENDRVSIRGTSPSLTQTLVNGHTVASGDIRHLMISPMKVSPGAPAVAW